MSDNVQNPPIRSSIDLKNDARDARLSIRKSSEEKYRKELLEIARTKCSDHSKAFRDCSVREGLLVVIKCREECRASNAF
jgi:hypothetical protein